MAKEPVNPRTGKGEAGEAPPAPPFAPTSPASPLRPFEEAYRSCCQALGEAQKELSARHYQDYRAFLEALQEPQHHVQRAWSEAQQDLERKRQELGGQQGVEAFSSWEEAWRGAADGVTRIQQEAQEQLARIQSDFAESQRAAWNDACRRYDEALRNYLRAFQGALQQIDASTFDLTLLAPIGQSLISVACWAPGARVGV